MRTKWLGTAAWVLGLAASAAAQQPGLNGGWGPYGNYGGGFGLGYGGGFGPGGLNPQNVMPNIYNPRTQPLSPYLNLLRGGNPGVNYYYGVRPGTTGGGAAFGAGMMAPGGFGRTNFPIQFTPDDALLLPEPGEGYTLPPAGHPTVFNNTLGYFPGPFGMGSQRGRMGFGGAGGMGGGGGTGAQQRTGTGVRR